MLTVSQQLLTCGNIRNGKVIKRLFFLDEYVSDIKTQTKSSLLHSKVIAAQNNKSDISNISIGNNTSYREKEKGVLSMKRMDVDEGSENDKIEQIKISEEDTTKNDANISNQLFKSNLNTIFCNIKATDLITAVTFGIYTFSIFIVANGNLNVDFCVDDTGKKIYVGTAFGRVLVYDSNTFGLISDLTTFDYTENDSTSKSSSQTVNNSASSSSSGINSGKSHNEAHVKGGAIAGLYYSPRDSILIAVNTSGQLKAFNGIVRTTLYASMVSKIPTPSTVPVQVSSPVDNAMDSQFVETLANVEDRRFPPLDPILLRCTTYKLSNDHSINNLAVSEDINAIAIGNVYGDIWIYSYNTFILQNLLRLPISSSSSNGFDTKSKSLIENFCDELIIKSYYAF